MSLYDNMLNIKNMDIEEIIKLTIADVKNKLDGLTFERTCLIYTTFIYNELKKRGINVKLMSTDKITNAYLHYFNIIPTIDYYYLIDLNFAQFNNSEFVDLLDNGYQMINNRQLQKYLTIVSQKKNLDSSFDELYFNTLV